MRTVKHWVAWAGLSLVFVACAPMSALDGDSGDAPDASRDARGSSDSGASDAASSDATEDSAVEDSAVDARERDGAIADSGVTPDVMADRVTPPTGPTLYPSNQTHSPISESVQRSMRAIAMRGGMDNTFAKVGDSQTVYDSGFMVCFAGTSVDLAGRDALAPTIAHFRAGRIAGVTPYERRPLSAVVGWSSGAPLAGSPAPLDQELAAAQPRFSLVMYGSNDSQVRNLPVYGENLWEIAERSIARGAIPVFTSAPPRGDSAIADQWIPWYAHVARAVAQAKQVPFIDLERALRAAPSFGLSGDNLHLSRSPRGACSFAASELRYGQNQRNLLTIEALDRARRALATGAAPLDPPGSIATGDGSVASPIAIEALPFADHRDTSRGGSMAFDRYSCSTANEGGREFVYRLELRAPARIHALVLDRGTVDVDLHRLTAPSASMCAARDDRQLVADLPAGTHYFSVDSYVPAGSTAREGEYIFVVFRAGP
ncbi:MAG: hypothetical protein JNK05_05580 [Myxococcales bacterium]|nr:hypothetical protein [Myxococcales bacterium]